LSDAGLGHLLLNADSDTLHAVFDTRYDELEKILWGDQLLLAPQAVGQPDQRVHVIGILGRKS
jgi:hypothetical protein